jgi:uncharacterized protein with beta-barrel porin domain
MSLKARLLLGATAPFVLVMPALAQVSISTATTAPVATATASSGSPADISITSAGSITIGATAGATAVTQNSSNSVSNAGAITINDSDNSTNVRILPGFNTSFTNSNTIANLEDYTLTDADGDGDTDGPVARGTGRTGVLVAPGGTMTGNMNLSGGSIVVEGNNSAGVSIQSTLAGTYRQKGAITVTGANSFGLDIREDVTGDVAIGGSVVANGENAAGVRVLGDVAGEFLIDGTISATGFTSTSITNYADPDLLGPNDTPIDKRRDADDLLVGGPGVAIRGDLARGLLVNGPAVGGTDPTDNVKDVIQDFNENRSAGSIGSFGSAPALLIQSLDGAAGGELRLGLVRETIQDTLDDDDDDNLTEVIGTFNYDYGLINRGTIAGNGLNIGFAATGARIAGSADGAHQTIIDGGVFNGGTISATAFEANATGFNLGAGATTPLLANTGAITAQVTTETDHDAVAVLVEAGANLPAVTNSGSIASQVRGYDGDTVAFRDLSGTVRTFTNNSRISTGYVDDDTTDNVTSGLGRAIALDFSRNTTGVTLTQTDAIDNTRIFGDVLFGAGNDRFDLLSGETVGDVAFGAGSDTLNISSARLTGDASFTGAAANVALTNAANFIGDLSFGSSASQFSLSGGSTYDGAITHAAGGSMALSVNGSTLNNRADGTLNLTSMNASNGARLGFVIDNDRVASGAPVFNVAGVADIAGNTVITPIFEEFTNQTFTLRLLNAGDLNLGGPASAMLNAQSPFLYNITLSEAAGGNGLDLAMSPKTSAQLGLNVRQDSALPAVFDLLENNADIGEAFTAISDAAVFARAFSDLLPGSDAAVMQVMASNSTAAFGATAHRLDLVTNKPKAPGGAWLEEFGVYHDSDSTTEGLGVSGGGFGVAGGVDLISSPTMVLGAFFSLDSLELEEGGRTSAPINAAQRRGGVYGGWKTGGFAINAAASGGVVELTSNRRIEVSSISDSARAEWDAFTYNVAGRATYTIPMGFLELAPYLAADYTGISQDGYTETTTDPDLAITVDEADGSIASASAGFTLGANFGDDDAFRWRPEISAGYRNILSFDYTPGAARFGGGTTTFNLEPGREPESAIVAGVGVNVLSQYLNMKFGYDAEIQDGATTHYGSITLRLAFF